DGAIASLKKILDLTPDDQGAITTLANLQEDAKHFAEAAALWERVAALRKAAGRTDLNAIARSQMCRSLAREKGLISEFPAGGVTVPLFSFNKVPAVKVLINGKIERYLVLDLSAQDSVVTAGASEALGLEEYGGPSNVAGSGSPGTPALAIFNAVQLGPLTVRRVPVSVNPFLNYPAENLAGLLGRRFLSEFLVTIDYVGRTVTFGGAPDRPIDGTDLYLNSGILVDGTSRGKAAGKFLVDTSTYTPGPVSLLWAQDNLGLNAASQGVTPILYRNYSYSFTMPELAVGGVSWRSYKATAIDLRSLSERIGTELSGILANSLLDDTKTTFDLSH
ncbi:MAG: aspartyl protease family protein, partial [Thermoplasmata archaeon]